jgi:KipI family sensor histidine kinase inhibitor
MGLRLDAYGPNAALLRFAADGDATAFVRSAALQDFLEHHPPAGLMEVTPGVTTLLLEFEAGQRPDLRLLELRMAAVLRAPSEPMAEARVVEIPMVYDGPDLDRVARQAGCSRAEVVALHAASVYRVQVLGFAPGFAYLSGLDTRLHTPRLDTPRPRVPAGSVAIGGPHTGVYPVATAGGWNLIGRTDKVLLDRDRAAVGDAAAFALHPGDAVRFFEVDGRGA